MIMSLYDFAVLVGKMRQAQRHYQILPVPRLMDKARALETEVDHVLTQVQANIEKLNKKLAEANAD